MGDSGGRGCLEAFWTYPMEAYREPAHMHAQMSEIASMLVTHRKASMGAERLSMPGMARMWKPFSNGSAHWIGWRSVQCSRPATALDLYRLSAGEKVPSTWPRRRVSPLASSIFMIMTSRCHHLFAAGIGP